MEREGGGSSDVQWKTVPQTSGCNRSGRQRSAISGRPLQETNRPDSGLAVCN